MTAQIPLSQGKFALVDEEDYERLSRYKWCAMVSGTYAGRHGGKKNGKFFKVYMHREVLNAPEGMFVDHINGNGLDNRRANLRIVSHRENMRNRRVEKGGTSKYKGVYWSKKDQKWVAEIMLDRKIRLGGFQSEIEAAQAYDAAAALHFGEHAYLNFK